MSTIQDLPSLLDELEYINTVVLARQNHMIKEITMQMNSQTQEADLSQTTQLLAKFNAELEIHYITMSAISKKVSQDVVNYVSDPSKSKAQSKQAIYDLKSLYKTTFNHHIAAALNRYKVLDVPCLFDIKDVDKIKKHDDVTVFNVES